MPEMRYDGETLRDGGRSDRESADHADSAAQRLATLNVTAGLFGRVGMAGQFAGAVSHAHREQTAGMRAASADRTDQGRRADGTAALGDRLTEATTSAATQGARAVADGM